MQQQFVAFNSCNHEDLTKLVTDWLLKHPKAVIHERQALVATGYNTSVCWVLLWYSDRTE